MKTKNYEIRYNNLLVLKIIMEENQNHNMEKRNEKNIYFTQFNFKIFSLFLLFFVSCSALATWLFIIYLDGKNEYVYYIIIPFIMLAFGTIIISFFPLFTKISIDIENDLIVFKHIKILFCLNKTNYLNLSEIEQVIVEKNTNVHYEMNDTKYDGFNLVFKMKKDKELRVLNGEEDKNFESQKIFDFLREILPKNIPVSSDLMEINEIYPNLNSQRIIGSSSSQNEYTKLNNQIISSGTALSFE